MKAIKQRICISLLTVMLLVIAASQQIYAVEQMTGSVKSVLVPPDSLGDQQKKVILERLTQLNRHTIREEFQDVVDIKQEIMNFFAYFSAMTEAFCKRLELQGVDQFTGKEDVWRVYYGGGAAAHSLFPEYFRLKREVMRQDLRLNQDDIQYNELSEEYRERDGKFQKKVAEERRAGMNPGITPEWDNSNLNALRAGILKLDRGASETFSNDYFGGLYKTDFSVVGAISDAIIRQEDRVWLFHELGLSDCLMNGGDCINSSVQFQKVAARLSRLKDDPVLNHYFPQLKNPSM